MAKLASRAFEEASRVVGLYEDLRDLSKTLSLVKAVLLDAQQKQDHNHQLREWLSQLKTIFSDAEDVLDEFECQTLRKRVVKAHGSTKDKVSNFFSTSNPLIFRYKMAQQIKDISNRLDKVAADRHKFSLQIIDVDTCVVHRRDMTHSRVSDSDVIGRKDDKEKVIELLMQQNPNDDDTSLSVIPIVGIGGLGKTTLAKFVFNDNRIQECFPLKMWVCVSDDFDIKQLIIKIINSAVDSASGDAPSHQSNLSMFDLEQLQNQLKNKLSGQKFLLVLDDVWNEDRVKWVELRNLIQVSVGSKVVVTTRSHSIASMMGTLPSHILEGLSEEDSLSLFVKWAFKEGEEEKHPHLVNIGRQIVKKCRGVPLAARTLGSLLFSKFEASEWEYVSNNEIWNLSQKKDDILPALKLSYDLMPSYLRQCFAMFSLYPKDYIIGNHEITSLWVALGLIAQPKSNRSREDVANQYLHELLSRSFLQDFKSYGTLYDFRIHDLVHDLALFVATNECLHVSSNIIQNIPDNVQHLSFAESSLFGNLVTKNSATVRTVLFPNDATAVNGKVLLNTCLSKFKYLRVMDLRGSTFETLPRTIAKLKHLRYLDISKNPNIKRLPDSICKLQSLQVLFVNGCMELEALPEGLRKFICLRDFSFSTKQTILPVKEIANLGSLKILNVESCHNVESIFGGVKFPSLKTLFVQDCQNLKSLWLDGQNFPELETLIVERCHNLDLELLKDGHEEEGPKLKLKVVAFINLPQLVALPKWLEEVGSNSLQCFILLSCFSIKTFPDWFTTLTDLRTLYLTCCPNLVSLPDNIHHLTSLETLRIVACVDLCKKYHPSVGEFWPKISHIKNIYIDEPKEYEKN